MQTFTVSYQIDISIIYPGRSLYLLYSIFLNTMKIEIVPREASEDKFDVSIVEILA